MIGVIAKDIADGDLFRDPLATLVDAGKAGLYAYLIGKGINKQWADSIEGYIYSVFAKRLEKSVVEIIRFAF